MGLSFHSGEGVTGIGGIDRHGLHIGRRARRLTPRRGEAAPGAIIPKYPNRGRGQVGQMRTRQRADRDALVLK